MPKKDTIPSKQAFFCFPENADAHEKHFYGQKICFYFQVCLLLFCISSNMNVNILLTNGKQPHQGYCVAEAF